MFCCAALPPHSLRSCDVCGSSVGNIGIGLLTDYRSNFIKLGYDVSPFKSTTERGYTVQDNFHQLDLSCRYSITKRIRLMAQLPFAYKIRKVENEQQIEQGLGDISISAAYVLLANKAIFWNTNLYLEAGVGTNVPTGKYDKDLHDKNLPESFNLGTGAFGYTAQTNVVWTYQKIGLVANALYQLNTKTEAGYKFGNQFTTRITGFKAWDSGKIQWIPNVGLGLESLAKDRFANNKAVPETGGHSLLAYTGINIKTEKWLAGLSYGIPLAVEYAAENTEVKGRISCQLSFLF